MSARGVWAGRRALGRPGNAASVTVKVLKAHHTPATAGAGPKHQVAGVKST